MKKALLIAAVSALALQGNALTVLLDEDFNDNYIKSFDYVLDNDGQMPASMIQALFLSASTGTYQPWWILRESNASADKFMGSHSLYDPAGTSDDWLISVPLDIDSKGYVLELDAQSAVLRQGDRLSDLQLYVLDGLPDPDNLPTTPDYVWEQIPTGPILDSTTDEWTRCRLSLDPWAGQTVRLCLVNRNTDRDLLCIDNVLVSRPDPAELEAEHPERYIVDCESYPLAATVTFNDMSPVGHWSLVMSDGTTEHTFGGDNPEPGSSVRHQVEMPIQPDHTALYTITLKVDDEPEIVASGEVSRLLFMPETRLLLEESTGRWCGNCPIGIYNLEAIHDDPDMGPRVNTVSVHVPGDRTDLMINEAYATQLGLNVAPVVKFNRADGYTAFSAINDVNYNPANVNSFAYRVAQELKAAASTIEVTVEGRWVITGNDTTAVACLATIRPAISSSDKLYRAAFILTENNVGIDNDTYWSQHNYFTGMPYESRLGGFSDLPEWVSGMRYNDVARAISHFNGLAGAFPQELKGGSKYAYSYNLAIPDVESVRNNQIVARGVCCSQCELTAVIFDDETGLVVNSARVALGDESERLPRFAVSDLLEGSLDTVEATPAIDLSTARWFDLQGRPVDTPLPGCLYIVRDAQGRAAKRVALP